MHALQYQTDVWTDEVFTPSDVSSGPMNPSGLSTSFESELDRQWANLTEELRHIRSLGNNWDEEGAQGPEPQVVDSVEDLFMLLRNNLSLPPPSRVVASPNGSVVVEWQIGDGRYMEVECSEPYRAEVMYVTPGMPTIHEEEIWEPTRFQRRSRYQAA